MNKLTPVFIVLAILALLFAAVDRASADTTIVVTPSSMGNWSFHQFAPAGSGAITDGPGTPPLGTGSARLTINNNGGMSLRNNDYLNTRLDALTKLEYSSYRSTSDPSNNRTVTLQFEMDYNLVDPDRSNQGWLVYEPYRTAGAGTVMEDTWYTWNALTGKWYATDTPGSTVCPQNNPCTIAQLLAAYPYAGVRHNGYVRFAAGSGWNLAFTGYADALTIGINGVNTTYNFENNDPPASVSAGGPYTGPEGQPVSVTGSATDPDGDPLTYAWSYTPGLGVDPGASCSFADPAAASTSVACTDAGNFTLTFSADDGVNPPVSASTTLTLSEADPSVSITSPADGASFRQGEQVDVSANVSDAANDTLACTVDWGNGNTSQGVIANGVCTASHTYDQPGDYTITVTVTDDDGGSASHTAGVTVFNDPPTADAGGPYTGDEGQPVSVTGSATDLEGDSLTYAWSYTPGLGVDPGASCSFADPAAASTTVTCSDAGDFTLTFSVDDGVNPPGSSSTTLTLSEADPSVSITSPADGASFRQGEQVDVSADVSDAGNDTLTCTVDWGDGTTSQGVIANGVCTASHTYDQPGDFTITVTVTDDDGGSASHTTGVTVFNDPPTADAGGPYTGDEGQPVSVTGSATDLEGDSLTFAWSYTPGLGVDPGASCSFADPAAASTTVTCSDAGDFTLTFSVDDGVNPPVSQSASLTLSEANPSVAIFSPTDGDTFPQVEQVYVFVDIKDAANDTLTCTVDWGDGTSSQGVIQDGVCSASHNYTAPGDYTITVTVTDDDGGSASQTSGITISNDPPGSISAGGPYTGDEGYPVSINGSVSDPEGDPLTYAWTYTRGPGVDSGTTCSFADPTALDTSITCTDNGLFTLNLTVDDGANPPVNDSTTMFLGNLEPVLNITSPQDDASFDQGQAVDLSARMEEAGDNDTLSCQIDWGNGTTVNGSLVGTFCNASHTYTVPGDYTITVTVTDDDGGSNSDTTHLTIQNVAPSVAITSPSEGSSFSTGDSVSASANVSDPGGADLLTCTVDWGDEETSDGVIVDGVCTAGHSYAQPGDYTITVTVSDGDGGSTSDAVSITVTNLAPTVQTGGPYTGGEGRTINLNGSASDPEGDSLTFTWTYIADADVDPGTSCSFADPAAAVTSVSCTDNGSFTLILTADDGVNPSVSSSAALTLNNRAPVVTLTTPAEGSAFTVGETVNLAATFTDSGSNDTHTCRVAWGDGKTTNGTVAAGSCSASHTYTAAGSYTITVTVKDDDNRSGSDSAAITINAAPNNPPGAEAGGPYTGGEGQAIDLSGSATDSDGDTLVVAWTYTPGANVDPGTTCTFGDAAAPATGFFCTDDGQFTLTLTVNDDSNPPVSDTTTVTVNNRPPVVSLEALLGNPIFQVGEEVPLTASITDPGINDTHVCQVNWGDGAVTDGAVSNGTCTASYAYSAEGEYTITMTVTDDDGGSDADSASVSVSGEPQPPATGVYLPLMNKDWNSSR